LENLGHTPSPFFQIIIKYDGAAAAAAEGKQNGMVTSEVAAVE